MLAGVILGSAIAQPAERPVPSSQAARPPTIHLGGFHADPASDPAAKSAADRSRALRLVQLTAAVRNGWRDRLERHGLEVLAYVPHNAYLVWTDEVADDVSERLDATPFVRWHGAVPPTAKHIGNLEPASGVLDLMVLYVRRAAASDLPALVASLGGRFERTHPAQPDGRLWLALIRIGAEQVPTLIADDAVVWVEPSPGAPELGGEMSSVIVSGAIEGGPPQPGYRSWLDELGYDGTGVPWAVVDSGVDPLHPDLAGLQGISYPGCETELPGDDPGFAGHGTPVASIVLGTAVGGFTDADGFLWGLGVAPGAQLVSQNAICNPDAPWPPTGGWQILSRDGMLAGAVGSNNSWNSQEGIAHGYQASERIHDLMVRDGNFDTPSVAEPYILVFNAGNQGPDPSTIPAPKEAKNLITVGAIDNWRVAGNLHTVVEYSSRGPTLDGRMFPTVVAPGRRVGAAEHRLGGFYGPIYEVPGTDGLYMSFEGTSAAAPHVSGILAVVTQWWRATRLASAPSPAAARAMVVNAAVPLDQGPAVPNFDVGWGLADLERIVRAEEPLWIADQAVTLTGTGESWQQEVVVSDPSLPLRVTLAWTDDAAAAGANPTLVNDLDLVVETAGASYLGNRLVDGWSVPGGSPDRLNNLENVTIAAPGGVALVRVTAANLPGDAVPYNGDTTDQDFALVCRNCRTPLPAPRRVTRRVSP
jgi:subtilisin family serine protease